MTSFPWVALITFAANSTPITVKKKKVSIFISGKPGEFAVLYIFQNKVFNKIMF